jgi:hypothetical protein
MSFVRIRDEHFKKLIGKNSVAVLDFYEFFNFKMKRDSVGKKTDEDDKEDDGALFSLDKKERDEDDDEVAAYVKLKLSKRNSQHYSPT